MGDLVPLAVFGIVARTVALKGFEPFKALGALIIAASAVFARLLLPDPGAVWFLGKTATLPLRRFDALLTAFSTASSTATMPITFQALRKIGLRNPPLP